MMSLDRGQVIAGVCAVLLLGASVSLVISDSVGRDMNSVGHRLADGAFAIAALSSLLLVFTRAGERDRRSSRLRFGVLPLVLGAAILPLMATAVRYNVILLYPAATAIAIGVSLSSVVFVLSGSSLESNWVKQPFKPTVILAAVILATLALRRWAPGSAVLGWLLAPVTVLLAPGLSLGAVLLSRSTPWSERLLWASPISVSVLVISCLWLDMLGVRTTRTGIMALTVGWTLAALPFLARVERAAVPPVS